jgi:hypothetical protein
VKFLDQLINSLTRLFAKPTPQMNPALIAAIIALIEEALKVAPGVYDDLTLFFYINPSPTPADWQALREKVLGKSYADYVPATALPAVAFPAVPLAAAPSPAPQTPVVANPGTIAPAVETSKVENPGPATPPVIPPAAPAASQANGKTDSVAAAAAAVRSASVNPAPDQPTVIAPTK